MDCVQTHQVVALDYDEGSLFRAQWEFEMSHCVHCEQSSGNDCAMGLCSDYPTHTNR